MPDGNSKKFGIVSSSYIKKQACVNIGLLILKTKGLRYTFFRKMWFYPALTEVLVWFRY